MVVTDLAIFLFISYRGENSGFLFLLLLTQKQVYYIWAWSIAVICSA